MRKQEFKYYPLLSYACAVLIVGVFFVWLNNSYGIFYYTNDDTGIMKTYSGYATGEPTAYHAYGSYTLGLFFKGLYTIMPTLNWYTYCSIIMLIISVAVIIDSVFGLRNEGNVFRVIDFLLISILTVAICLYGINRISWTMNAALAAVAGVMLLLSYGNEKKKKRYLYVFALIFSFISLIIRGASYKAVLPFGILVIVYSAYRRLDKPLLQKKNLRVVVMGMLLMLPFLLVYGYGKVDSTIRQTVFPSGSGTFEYYRGLYTDSYHIPYEGNEEFYESIGWDAELYNMARSWFFLDRRFNTENLKKIAEKSAEERSIEAENSGNQIYWDEFVNLTKENPVRVAMTSIVVAMAVIGLIMTLYCLVKKRNLEDWIFLSATQLLAIAEWVWLVAGRGRFIDRAFYCAAIPALCVGMWVIAKNAIFIDKYRWVYVFIGIFAIWSFQTAWNKNVSKEAADSARASSQVSVDADEIAFTHPENFYIFDTSIAGGVQLFLNMDWRGCGRNRMLWGGVPEFVQSPSILRLQGLDMMNSTARICLMTMCTI